MNEHPIDFKALEIGAMTLTNLTPRANYMLITRYLAWSHQWRTLSKLEPMGLVEWIGTEAGGKRLPFSDQNHPNPTYRLDEEVCPFEDPEHDPAKHPFLSDLALDRLEYIVQYRGLSPFYDSIEGWLFDFYPSIDMRTKDDLVRITSDKRFEAIAAAFIELFGFDLRAELDPDPHRADREEANQSDKETPNNDC